ncbi:MAG: tetratricopeptide repeat protein [Smithellaceae bacterium]|nr:tetratricopeptide repeat protein [Smithellaceae bacterium]
MQSILLILFQILSLLILYSGDGNVLYAAEPPGEVSEAKATKDTAHEEAVGFFNRQKYQEALASFEGILREAKYDGAQREEIDRYLAESLYHLGREGRGIARIKAIEHLKEVLKNYQENREKNVLVHFMLARTYEDLGFDYEALGQYEKFQKANKDIEYDQEALYKIAFLLNRVRRHRQAIERLGEYLRKHPKGLYTRLSLFVLADSYMEVNQETQAKLWYMEARKLTPELSELPGEILFKYGRYEFKSGRYMEAITILSQFLNLFPPGKSTEKAIGLLADSYAGAGLNEKALKFYSLLMERTKDPKVLSAASFKIANIGVAAPNIKIASLLPGMENYFDPIKTYDRLMAEIADPSIIEDILIRKAAVLTQKGKRRESLDIYIKMLKQGGTVKRREEVLGLARENGKHLLEIYYKNGEHLEVTALYYELNAQKVNLHDELPLLFLLCESFEKIGLYDQVRTLYQLSLSITKDRKIRADIFLSLARANLVDGKYAQVESVLKSLREEGKLANRIMEAQVLLMEAESQWMRGLADKAVTNYKKAVIPGVDFPTRDLLNYTDALRKINLLPAAIAQYEKIIGKLKTEANRSGETAVVYTKQGDSLFQLRKYRDGIDAYQNAIAGKLPPPEAIWATYQIGSGYLVSGNYSQAEKSFLALKELTSQDPYWTKLAEVSLMEARRRISIKGGEGGRP